MNDANTTGKTVATGAFRPRLSYYHPNARGTGCAVQFELHPAHESTSGSIFASFAAWVVLPEPCKPQNIITQGGLDGKLILALLFPINAQSSSFTILTTCCAGVRLFNTSSPTARAETFATKSFTTL